MSSIVLLMSALAVFQRVSLAFDPTLSLDNCSQRSLRVTLEGASDEGIIYIQGQEAVCRYPTTSSKNVYTFDFDVCNIKWETTFRIIVQEKSRYMTRVDKQISVTCLGDTSDISVSNNVNMTQTVNTAGQNLTVKPTARMTILRDGMDIGSKVVMLGDQLTMVISLDPEYIDDFDIKAKYCTASSIEVIYDSCAVDTDLFGHMRRLQQGLLQTTFAAFRTTSLENGPVFMPFICTLQVCIGECKPTPCIDGVDGYGRKRRDDVTRTNYAPVEDINVGMTLAVSSMEVTIEADDEPETHCMNMAAFVTMVAALTGGLVMTTSASIVMYKKVAVLRTALNKTMKTQPADGTNQVTTKRAPKLSEISKQSRVYSTSVSTSLKAAPSSGSNGWFPGIIGGGKRSKEYYCGRCDMVHYEEDELELSDMASRRASIDSYSA